jgi:hypothetical protein
MNNFNNKICFSTDYLIILFIILIIFTTMYIYKFKNNHDTNIIQILQKPEHKRQETNVLYDPLKPPERINNGLREVATRGNPENYQLLGLLTRSSDEKILQLFGRPTYRGSNQYEYFARSDNFGFINKIPITSKGNKEILDNDIIDIDEFDKSKGSFKVKIYNYETPRYYPDII